MITEAPLGLFLGIICYLVAALIWLHLNTSETSKAAPVLVGAAVWLSLSAALPVALTTFDAPASAQFFAFTPFLVASIWVGFSGYGARIAAAPLWALTMVHVFRIPLEIVLDVWAHAGAVPVQMTYRGDNFDILTGICAGVLGIALLRHERPPWVSANQCSN